MQDYLIYTIVPREHHFTFIASFTGVQKWLFKIVWYDTVPVRQKVKLSQTMTWKKQWKIKLFLSGRCHAIIIQALPSLLSGRFIQCNFSPPMFCSPYRYFQQIVLLGLCTVLKYFFLKTLHGKSNFIEDFSREKEIIEVFTVKQVCVSTPQTGTWPA